MFSLATLFKNTTLNDTPVTVDTLGAFISTNQEFMNRHYTSLETYAASPAFAMRRQYFEARKTVEHRYFNGSVQVRTLSLDGSNSQSLIELDGIPYGTARYEAPHIFVETPLGVLAVDVPTDYHIQNIHGRIQELARDQLHRYPTASRALSDFELARDLFRFASFIERHTLQRHAQEHLDAIQGYLPMALDKPFRARQVICHDHVIVVRTATSERQVGVYGYVSDEVVVYSRYGDFTIPIDTTEPFDRQIADGLLAQAAQLDATRLHFKKHGITHDITLDDYRALLTLEIAIGTKRAFDDLLQNDPKAFREKPLAFAALSASGTSYVDNRLEWVVNKLENRFDMSSDYSLSNHYGLDDLNWSALYAEGRLKHDVTGAWLLDGHRIGQLVSARNGDDIIPFRKKGQGAHDDFLAQHNFDLIHPLGVESFSCWSGNVNKTWQDWFDAGADNATETFITSLIDTSWDVAKVDDPWLYFLRSESVASDMRNVAALNSMRRRLKF